MFHFFNNLKQIIKNINATALTMLVFCFIYAYSTYINNYFLIYKITNADIPKKWQISFQDPATVSIIGVIDIHHTIMFWLVYIFIVVFFLIAIEVYSSIGKYSFFSISSQSVCYSLKECSWLKIFWTTVSSAILFYEIFFFVYVVNYRQDKFSALMTTQVIKYQWYWSYKHSIFSNLIKTKKNKILGLVYRFTIFWVG